MYRGIKGTFVYACDRNLREYFKKYLQVFNEKPSLRVLKQKDIIPHVNSVPYYDISVAAGNFTEAHISYETKWVELPLNVAASKDFFVCKIKGESMNARIPDGSLCLFRKYSAGSREGKIVLVQHYSIQDSDFGAGFTIKEYHSLKNTTDEDWHHNSIELKPLSYSKKYKSIFLKEDELAQFKVIGIFVDIIKVN